MKLRTEAPRWFREDRRDLEAKCASFPATPEYDAWYGEVEEKEKPSEMLEAQKICLGTDDGRVCPLLESCLKFALDNNERYGVWGGTTPEERITLRKEKRLWRPIPVGDPRKS